MRWHLYYLHSNLVIFEYLSQYLSMQNKFVFTFQSGDIQMSLSCFCSLYISSFTFQSGDIRIWKRFRKWGGIPTFTFQSGDIRMTITAQQTNMIFQFTFQSGDIQMLLLLIFLVYTILIYIPIWWYSNSDEYKSKNFRAANLHSNLVIFKSALSIPFYTCWNLIYIPIWWYSNIR